MFAHGTWLIDGRLFPPPFFRRLPLLPAVGTSLPPDYPPPLPPRAVCTSLPPDYPPSPRGG